MVPLQEQQQPILCPQEGDFTILKLVGKEFRLSSIVYSRWNFWSEKEVFISLAINQWPDNKEIIEKDYG
mgnify:CR=1 FL=1